MIHNSTKAYKPSPYDDSPNGFVVGVWALGTIFLIFSLAFGFIPPVVGEMQIVSGLVAGLLALHTYLWYAHTERHLDYEKAQLWELYCNMDKGYRRRIPLTFDEVRELSNHEAHSIRRSLTDMIETARQRAEVERQTNGKTKHVLDSIREQKEREDDALKNAQEVLSYLKERELV